MTLHHPRPRLCYLVTTDASVGLIRGQLRWMREAGFEVTLISNDGPRLKPFCEAEGVQSIAVPMQREITPAADAASLLNLTRVLRGLSPHIVNAATPKAGLLGMAAATLARVPVRVYHLLGLRLETVQGAKRRLLHTAESVACRAAHRVFCISQSLREVCHAEGLAAESKARLIGAGSHNGIQAGEFAPAGSDRASAWRSELRQAWRIPEDAFVFGTVGRITRDKGIEGLYEAFLQVATTRPESRLLLVGAIEEGDPISPECLERLRSDPRVTFSGYLDAPAQAYAAMDVLVHPSLREGFGNAPVEGSASGLPTIGRRVTGVVDAIRDGVTGVLVKAAGNGELVEAMLRYADHPELGRQHGLAGRERVVRELAPESIWGELAQSYEELLAERGLPLPTRGASAGGGRAAA